MTIGEIVASRGVSEVVHYTTNPGLTGILALRTVLSRARLPQDKYVEHVYQPACEIRKDEAWFDYINLSISRINVNLFDIASKKWHASKEFWWCILSFDPAVLSHEGVYFATTNNMYSGCVRATEAKGLNALFEPTVHQYASRWARRENSLADRFTTCRQAEALYPRSLSTEFLRTIYVATEDHSDTVSALCATLGHESVNVIIRPEAFT